MVNLPLSLSSAVARLRTGIDVVQISRIEESFRCFGDRFAERLFTVSEIDYSGRVPALAAQRYAARFAAKEATLKALDLAHAGIDWREIEVVREPCGACRLALHGKAARLVEPLPAEDLALSLSHDGDYAVAIVVALRDTRTSH